MTRFLSWTVLAAWVAIVAFTLFVEPSDLSGWRISFAYAIRAQLSAAMWWATFSVGSYFYAKSTFKGDITYREGSRVLTWTVARVVGVTTGTGVFFATMLSGVSCDENGTDEFATHLNDAQLIPRLVITLIVVLTFAFFGAVNGEAERERRLTTQNGPAETGPA